VSTTQPSSIGRYEIIGRLGEGGMGAVFLGRDPLIERQIAVKFLREGLENDELRERFVREARSAGRLQHVNIVVILDVGEQAGRPYIAMEYVEGSTIADMVRAQAMLLAGGTALEAGVSYLTAPAALMAPLTVPRVLLFWSSIAALLGGLSFAKAGAAEEDREFPPPSRNPRRGGMNPHRGGEALDGFPAVPDRGPRMLRERGRQGVDGVPLPLEEGARVRQFPGGDPPLLPGRFP